MHWVWQNTGVSEDLGAEHPYFLMKGRQKTRGPWSEAATDTLLDAAADSQHPVTPVRCLSTPHTLPSQRLHSLSSYAPSSWDFEKSVSTATLFEFDATEQSGCFNSHKMIVGAVIFWAGPSQSQCHRPAVANAVSGTLGVPVSGKPSRSGMLPLLTGTSEASSLLQSGVGRTLPLEACLAQTALASSSMPKPLAYMHAFNYSICVWPRVNSWPVAPFSKKPFQINE